MTYEVQSAAEIPFSQCEVATIYPLARGEFAGTLEAGGMRCKVRITRNIEGSDVGPAYVHARVFPSEAMVPEGDIDKRAMEVAMRAKSDEEWGPFSVELRYGLLCYSKIWNCKYPDAAAMDEFLLGAKSFIEKHGDYIDSIVGQE